MRGLQGEVHYGGWLRFDGSRLAEERGACYTELGRLELAESALTAALAGNLSARRHGVVLTDLALLGAQRGDLAQLTAHGAAALHDACQTGSGVIARKLFGLQTHLAPLLSDKRVRELDQQITALAGGAAGHTTIRSEAAVQVEPVQALQVEGHMTVQHVIDRDRHRPGDPRHHGNLRDVAYARRMRLPAPSCPRNRQPRRYQAEPAWMIYSKGRPAPRMTGVS